MEQTLSFRKYAWNLQSCSSFIFFTVILTRRWITQPLIALNGYTCFHLFGVSFTTVPSTWRLRSILGAGDRSKILYYCCHWCTGIAVWAGHSAKVEACKDCSSMFQLPWDNPRRTEGKKRERDRRKEKETKEREKAYVLLWFHTSVSKLNARAAHDWITHIVNKPLFQLHRLANIGYDWLQFDMCFSPAQFILQFCRHVNSCAAAEIKESKGKEEEGGPENYPTKTGGCRWSAHTHIDIYICMYVYYTHLIYSPGLWTVESSATAIPQSSPVH